MSDNVSLLVCEHCQGEGRLYFSSRDWRGASIEVDGGECPRCFGFGECVVETEPVTEEEIMEPRVRLNPTGPSLMEALRGSLEGEKT